MVVVDSQVDLSASIGVMQTQAMEIHEPERAFLPCCDKEFFFVIVALFGSGSAGLASPEILTWLAIGRYRFQSEDSEKNIRRRHYVLANGFFVECFFLEGVL